LPKTEIQFYALFTPTSSEPANAIRAAHGDINLITLLMGAQGKDYKFKITNGDWIDAIAEPDELVINVGDVLSRQPIIIKVYYSQVLNPPREL
jgi:isopenicillin N synthase-like dioxygenase